MSPIISIFTTATNAGIRMRSLLSESGSAVISWFRGAEYSNLDTCDLAIIPVKGMRSVEQEKNHKGGRRET